MSANTSSTTALRKKLDEKNSNILRELLALPANKYCFECGQRGPTYANITNGSFCCMHCSGLLRGLNPPHRVKSISMSTFTDDDIRKLRLAGNEANSRIWLGLYDKKVKFDPRVDDDVRQYLIQKYENRRWYVSPDDLAEQKKLLDEHSANQQQRSTTLIATDNNSVNTAAGGVALQRRDSIKSHQSNQSAPPNLHPNNRQDPFDLLTGDFSLASSTATPKLSQPSFRRPIPTTLSNTLFTPNFAAFATTAAQPSLSYSGGAVQNTLHMPPMSFNSSDAISVGSTTTNVKSLVPNAFSASVLSDTSFAEFDAKFDSLKVSSTPQFQTTQQLQRTSDQQQHTQPNSVRAANRTIAAPLQLPQGSSDNTMQSTTNSETVFSAENNKDSGVLMQKQIGMTKDGRPIMSTSTTLPDYSALEELFRGPSSVAGSGISTTAPSFVQSQPMSFPLGSSFGQSPFGTAPFVHQQIANTGSSFGVATSNNSSSGINSNFMPTGDAFSAMTPNAASTFDAFGAMSQHNPVLKSTTTPGIYQANDDSNNPAAFNQFHSFADFSATHQPQTFGHANLTSQLPFQNNSATKKEDNLSSGDNAAVKNWNPFAS